MGWERELAMANQHKAKLAKDAQKAQKELQKQLKRLSKPKKILQYDIFLKVEDAIGSSFPDGDPIDHLCQWMERSKLDIEDIDRAVNRYAKVKTGMYGYLAQIWDNTQSDRLADANKSTNQEPNPFYAIQNGTVVPQMNPWR